ncbi:SEC-C domain-containing protein [Blastococcus sp. TF02A-26]|uniref:SEC-C domain-containing protein n=1 Tax=Blastococcus sp. TF02A-26 TaxID=2250577 RepID=UPI0011BF6242|nr:SEC-C domain-containing protein [Blastococcus sp. TF02A-26]
MDAERASFLAAADARDSDEGPGPAALRSFLDDMLARQVAEDDPPEVWATVRRLLGSGMGSSEVHRQLRLALSAEVLAAVGDDAEFDRQSYVAALGRLPLPSGARVEAAIIEVVGERQPVAADEVDRMVAERLGLSVDDPLTETLLDRVSDHLLDEDGPVALLAGDLMVHVPSLVENVVLTHRLTEDEQRTGVLAAADLPGLDRLRPLQLDGSRVHDYRGEDGIRRWWGPEGWLAAAAPGSLLAVQVRSDGAVERTVLTEQPEAEPALVAAIRAAYDATVEEPWLPVAFEELLLAVLAADRGAFTRPAPPLSELAAAAGLEQRGDYLAHEESVWEQARLADRSRRVFDRLGTGAMALSALRALTLIDTGLPDASAAHELLELLYDLAVLEVVADELFGTDDDPMRVAECAALAGRLTARASRPRERAVAHWLAAVAAERRGAVEEAESLLRSAVRADPGWPAAEDRLAWYEFDRGHAAAAAAGWRRLGLTAEDSADLAMAEQFETPADDIPRLGRNEPCWCGSGRKYKHCHLGRPAELPPLPERTSWLRRKTLAYLQRRGGAVESVIADHALTLLGDAADDEEAFESAMFDPLVIDVVLHEDGWLQRFLTDRGRLLPDDEAMLISAWLLCERTVVEVLDAVPGREVTVRDLRTGDRIAVREHTFSEAAEPGQLLCVRMVPDGQTHQCVGAAFRVAPGTEAGLLEVLDEHDGYELLSCVAALLRPPTLTTRDGDPLADCRAELRVPDLRAARSALNERYESDGDGWVSLFASEDDPEGVERSVRAWVQLNGDTLSVHTMSESRLDAVLADLRAALPDLQLLSEQRQPLRQSDSPSSNFSAAATSPAQVPAEALLELLDRHERRWCDEQVPALGGLTPRQAAADPTRRDELARLIAGFPEIDPASGAFGLRPARLRQLLGLADG